MSADIDLMTLSKLVNMPVRTIRYYIQKGLVDAPIGAKRNARYSSTHAEQLMTIQRWRNEGVSLDRIKHLLESNDSDSSLSDIQSATPKPGSINVISQVYLANGLTLQVIPEQCELNSDEIRELSKQIVQAYQNIKRS